MAARASILLCVAVISVSALGQTTPPATQGYEGVVTGTNVYVRSGPAASTYYPCSKVNYPDRVTVLAEKEGWLKILPTRGCFSIISQQYVTPDATGTTGAVTGSDVWVRAGGELVTANFWQLQTKLQKGDKVAIRGQVTDKYGKWYKITPPKGVVFYISAQFVRQQDGAPVATTRPATTQPVKPSTQPVAGQTGESEEEFAKALDTFETRRDGAVKVVLEPNGPEK